MSMVRVYKNARGEAFKQLFEHIKGNYPDKKFQRKDMPQVPRAFPKEVERQTAGTHWMDSSPSIAAAEALLIDMCNHELSKRRDVKINVYGDMHVFFSLTAEGKRTEVVLG